jgi:hypothetical protein
MHITIVAGLVQNGPSHYGGRTGLQASQLSILFSYVCLFKREPMCSHQHKRYLHVKYPGPPNQLSPLSEPFRQRMWWDHDKETSLHDHAEHMSASASSPCMSLKLDCPSHFLLLWKIAHLISVLVTVWPFATAASFHCFDLALLQHSIALVAMLLHHQFVVRLWQILILFPYYKASLHHLPPSQKPRHSNPCSLNNQGTQIMLDMR